MDNQYNYLTLKNNSHFTKLKVVSPYSSVLHFSIDYIVTLLV